jgi:four helix bundle protein
MVYRTSNMEYKKQNSGKILSFKDLDVWKEGHKLVLTVYTTTKSFPKEERFGLTDQMRRCVVSITSNIAEGFSRQGVKEKLQFYYMSKGSLTELYNQILIAKDINYIDNETFKGIEDRIIKVGRILTGLIRSTKNL